MRLAGTEYSLQHKALEVYVAGCLPPRCRGCHNPELWDFRAGFETTNQVTRLLLHKINTNELIENVWFLGGEPLDQEPNVFFNLVRSIYEGTEAKLWLFTGYAFEAVPTYLRVYFDYIKSGRYMDDFPGGHNEYGVTLASGNQHIYRKGLDYRDPGIIWKANVDII